MKINPLLRYQAQLYRFVEEFNQDTTRNLEPTYFSSLCLGKVDEWMLFQYGLKANYYDGINQEMYRDLIKKEIADLENNIVKIQQEIKELQTKYGK